MIYSMTGYGRGAGELDGQSISVEVVAVNHRFLDVSLRMPNEWAALDPVVREALKQRLSRGKLTVNVNRKRGAAGTRSIKFDPDAARQYVDASRELGQMLGSTEAFSVNTLSQLEGVFYYEQSEEDLEAVKSAVLGALEEAVEKLNEMRSVEGAALAKDLALRGDLIRKSLAVVEDRLPELNTIHEERLRSRIQELNEDANLTEERIALELAMMAEKGDVTEETVRLKTHLDLLSELLGAEEPIGRKLNFLTQEIQREINTLGSKVRDSDVAREVLDMKAELEKIREQVQNIE